MLEACMYNAEVFADRFTVKQSTNTFQKQYTWHSTLY